MVERVLLASPRGYCAGVERAVETVVRALEHYGPPVYVRTQIVHNIHVVRELEARGAIFVEEETEVPPGATVVYSVHGVAPSVFASSARLRHNVIDAVCPLVTKVHMQAVRYARAGYMMVLIGHEGHEEVERSRLRGCGRVRSSAGRHLRLLLHEDRAARLEVADDVDVVDDLLADVHRRPVVLEGQLDRLDGAFDPCAVPARRRQEDPLDHRGTGYRGPGSYQSLTWALRGPAA